MQLKLEKTLIKALKKGQKEEIKKVFEEIYNKYYKLVYFCLTKYFTNADIIEDITNDVFVSFFENANKINKSIKYYLLKTAQNYAFKALSNMKKTELFDENNVIDNDSNIDTAYYSLVNDLSKVLSKKEVSIIIYHAVEGLTFKEMEDIFQMKAKAINKVYERAIKKFRNNERSKQYEK